jgi:hypothetical protein
LLTVEELGRVVGALGLDELVPIFAARKVTGNLLSFCEEAAELEDFGVTSKPVERMLMAQIKQWKEHGVEVLP